MLQSTPLILSQLSPLFTQFLAWQRLMQINQQIQALHQQQQQNNVAEQLQQLAGQTDNSTNDNNNNNNINNNSNTNTNMIHTTPVVETPQGTTVESVQPSPTAKPPAKKAKHSNKTNTATTSTPVTTTTTTTSPPPVAPMDITNESQSNNTNQPTTTTATTTANEQDTVDLSNSDAAADTAATTPDTSGPSTPVSPFVPDPSLGDDALAVLTGRKLFYFLLGYNLTEFSNS